MRIDKLHRQSTFGALLFIFLLSTINSLHGQQLFWVGNGGNWNDTNNWSLTSGGPGGAGVPDATTNVFFDTNSGACVLMNDATVRFVELNFNAALNIDAVLTVVDAIDFQQGGLVNDGELIAAEIRSLGILDRSFDSSGGTIRIRAMAPQIASLSMNSENLDFGGINQLIFEGAELARLETIGSLGIFNNVEFTIDGEIYGNNEINILRITNGKSLYLQNNSTQIINEDLVTNDPCNGYATVSGFLDSNDPASLDIRIEGNYRPSGFFFRKIDFIVIVQGVRFPIDLRFSIDGGENGEWAESSNPAQRDLYWVGSTGEWFDPNNWSLESGGPGGECVPTSLDNVFFDENSFSSNADFVSSESAGYCNNFNYSAPESGTTIILPQLYINNDLNIDNSFNSVIGFITLSGNREGGASRMQLVKTSGTILSNLQVFSERNIELQDDLNVQFDITVSGFDGSVRFITNGHDISTGRFFAINNLMGLDLSNSYILVTGTTIDTEQPLTIRNSDISSVNNTRWEFTNEQTGFETNESEIGSVWFNNPGGIAQAFSSRELVSPYIRFSGNGSLFGNDFLLDSLIFSPGNAYTINHNNSLTVNDYFESLGDLCQPIFFASSVGNIQETLFMPSSAVLEMSYTEIQDIAATGGNTFDAGVGSVDLGNNSGWSFRDPNAQEVNRFLGQDLFVCNSEDNVRFTLNFTTDEVDSIKWNNGNPQPVTTPFIVNTREAPAGSAEVFAEVFFSNGCSQRDTVMVTVNEQFSFDLGNDTTLCNGAAIQLNIPIDNAVYNWSNEEVDQSIFIVESGDYAITVDSGACSFSDEIAISAIDLNTLSLGNDTIVCDEGTIILGPMTDFEGTTLWSDNSTTATIEVDQTGLYWAEFSQDICTRRDSIELTFENAFDIDLGNDTTLCNGAELTLSTGRDAGTFNWSTGDTKPLITISDGGVYSVEVQVGTCIAADTIEVGRIDIKEFNLGDDQTLCQGESSTLSIPEGFNGEFAWSTGASSPTIDVTEGDTYSLTISEDICSQTDSINIAFDTPQAFDLGGDTVLCAGEILQLGLENLPMDVTIGIQWTNGVNAQPSITVDQDGMYGVAVTIGACTTGDTIDVSFAEVLDFSLGNDTTICSVEDLRLLAPAEAVNLLWSDQSNGESLDILTSGTYWLEISEGSCTARDSIDIVVEEQFTIDLGNDTTLCSGELLVLNSSQDNGVTNLWNIGSTDASITVTESGVYGVLVESEACFATDDINVSYIDVDNFSIGNDTTLCIGDTLTLSAALSDQASYQWQDGSNDPTFSVVTGGTYSVRASIERCEATAMLDVDFQEKPEINLGEDMTLCEPDFVILDAGINGATYTWQDGSTEQTIRADFTDVYVVEINDGICIAKDTVAITIQDRPNLTIASDGEGAICRGDSVILSANTNGVRYKWQDDSTDEEFVANETGLYIAEMSFGVCVVRDSFDLVVNENPVVSLPLDTAICDNTSITIDLPADGLSYTWTGIQSTSNSVTLTESGSYSVQVLDTNGCQDDDQFNLSLKETPNFNFGEDQTICEGEMINLLVTPSYPDIIWSVPNTGSGLSVTTAGVFWAEASQDGCSFRDSIIIDVQAFPIVNLGNDTIICEGSTITLDAFNENAMYAWSTGETTPNISLTGSGTGMISVTVDIEGCATSDEINIDIKETPEFSLREDATICEDDNITLSVDNPDNRWSIEWSTGELDNDIMITEAGNYSATATINGCSSEDEFVLSVQPLPEFDLGDDFSKCEDLTATLSIDRSDVNVEWQDGTAGNQYIVTDPGLYTAIATTSLGCSFTDDIDISNRECVAFTIYIPNAFSPNQDGRNDRFLASIPEGVFILEYEMQIFDRWGNQVFEALDINVGWDGGGLGFQSMQPGVYVYNVRVRYSDDYQSEIQETFTGNITLVE